TRRRRGGVLVSPGGLPAGLPVDAGERGDVHGVPLAQLTPLGERCRVGESFGEPGDLFRCLPRQRPRDLDFAGGGGDNLRRAWARSHQLGVPITSASALTSIADWGRTACCRGSGRELRSRRRVAVEVRIQVLLIR